MGHSGPIRVRILPEMDWLCYQGDKPAKMHLVPAKLVDGLMPLELIGAICAGPLWGVGGGVIKSVHLGKNGEEN